ncbi:iron-containing alcohol dehydrogenase [uncultured Bacteroides sp.]|uniref:iron-containing alcohol dehydrogenase n=1 Tax=uncultured Bacteroides sp. TaxID=162156 RepID=UPI0025FECED8|nr:iron-containing alcohol dehydrogenase [uncultured Bacteroides sp.]
MNNFIFQNTTKIYFGKDQLVHLAEEIKQYGSRVLLTYGGGSIKRIGLYDRIMAVLKETGITVTELSGVEPNPRHTTVNRGADICKKENIDVLLAVGGGSTIDCTKAIAAAAYYDGDSWDLVKQKAQVTKALPILTVLTLAATGSEMDCGGVITNMDTNEKLGLIHPLLQPKVSFLDPTNTFSVNAFQTACGSADIISHVLDVNYFTTGEKMDMASRMQEEVIRTVVKFAPVAIKEPDNYEARANLMWASTWALNGFLDNGIMQAPTCHMIEHELSAFYDITHGLGLAILTPRWMEYILDETTAPQFKNFGVNLFSVDSSLSEMDGAKEAIKRLSDFLYQDLGLQSSLSEIGIKDDSQFAAMAEKACPGGVLNGYKPLTPKDVVAIFNNCL